MKLLVQQLNGQTYHLEDYGIDVLDFEVDAPEADIEKEYVEGRNGWVDMGATFKGRTMRADFYLKNVGYEFALVRNEIFKIFRSNDPFYLIDLRERGKRWLVRANNYPIKQLTKNQGEFSIDFKSSKSYAESVGTTLTPFTFDAEVWGVGMGLIDADEMEYEHTTNEFDIYNAGVVAIDPVEDDLKIKFTGASEGLKIENKTTGDVFEYYGQTNDSDVLELNGVEVLLNGINVLGNSNMELITLAEGFNEFLISGSSGAFNITFEFRFKYE